MARDCGLIDHLIEICMVPFLFGGLAMTKRSQAVILLRDTLSINYDCLKFAMAEYRPNELYCSQWLGLLIEDTFKNASEVVEKVENTLKELLDNNQVILEKTITDSIILKFIEYLAKDPKAKYIELLNVMIVCNSEPILINQKRIAKILKENRVLRNKTLVFLKSKSAD